MKEFIKDCKYKTEITQAIKYENELSYFIQTHNNTIHINSDESIESLYEASNPFINWVRGWMRKDNFKSYMKYLRHPLPTASLIQDDITPELKKVFDATNSYYDYTFTSKSSQIRSSDIIDSYNGFYKNEVFKRLINSHNSIVITDYLESKKPYRYFIDISAVQAIEPTIDGKIKKIVFKGINKNGDERYFYYTDEFYSVYIKTGEDYILESSNPHKIEQCPADFISVDPLNNNVFVTRKSIFSNFKEKFENYVNYYTLQKMCIPNGALPVITHYKKNNKVCNSVFENGTRCVEGYLSGKNGVLGNKDNLVKCPICNQDTVIQAGTVIGMPVPKFGENGERPVDLNANFVKFHYIPVDILTWIDDFVDKKYSEIKFQLVGKGVEDSNGQAKNVDQIARGNQTLENTLIELSGKLSELQTSLDSKLLRIVFGKAFKSAYIDKGTDFYLETEFELRDSLGKAIDPIDKENIISRINYSIYKNNPNQLLRNNVLYKLLPYSTITDTEFMSLIGVNLKQKELRLNFPYYIDLFESQYGKINIFMNEFFDENATDIKKLNTARTLLNNLIIIDYERLQNEDDTGEGNSVRSKREAEEQIDSAKV